MVVAAKAIDHFTEADIGLSPAIRDAWLSSSDLDSQPADLPADLDVESGDAAAIQRLTGELDRLQELIGQLRR